MIRPTLREAQDLAASGDYRMIPVSRELYADGHTPIGVADSCRSQKPPPAVPAALRRRLGGLFRL